MSCSRAYREIREQLAPPLLQLNFSTISFTVVLLCQQHCVDMREWLNRIGAIPRRSLMASSEEVRDLFPAMVERFVPEKAEGITANIQFDLSGDNGGLYWLKIVGGTVDCGAGQVDNPAMTVKASADDWHAVATGQMNAMQAFMTGKLKVLGDMSLAMRLQTMFAQ